MIDKSPSIHVEVYIAIAFHDGFRLFQLPSVVADGAVTLHDFSVRRQPIDVGFGNLRFFLMLSVVGRDYDTIKANNTQSQAVLCPLDNILNMHDFMQSTYFHLLCSFFLLRLFYLVLFRLYLHPLRSFPGPRLAAITDYYQAYYAIWQNGMFAKHTEELHRIYGTVIFLSSISRKLIGCALIKGPVVRVRPNEVCLPIFGRTLSLKKAPQLHFQSPEAYFAIYSPHSGFTKDPFFYTGAVDDSIIGAIDVQKHKVRRDTISPLFSRRAILKLEDVVQEKVCILSRLSAYTRPEIMSRSTC